MGDWHKVLGITAIAFNFVFAITGAWLGLQPIIMKKLGFSAPNEYQINPSVSPEMDRKITIDWPQVFRSAERYFTDLQLKSISISDDGSNSLTLQGNISGLVYERNINTLILDKKGSKELYHYDVRKKPFLHKLFFVQEALHFGDFGGLAVKALYAILGLMAAFLSISGFIIYLFRTEKKEKRETGAMKIVFIGTAMIIFILAVTALLTLSLGYDLTATGFAIMINGAIGFYLVYKIFRYNSSTLLKASA